MSQIAEILRLLLRMAAVGLLIGVACWFVLLLSVDGWKVAVAFLREQVAPPAIFLFVTFLALSFYFFPSLVAHERRHPAGEGIFILNSLFGWTFLGWVVALVWAYTAPQPPRG